GQWRIEVHSKTDWLSVADADNQSAIQASGALKSTVKQIGYLLPTQITNLRYRPVGSKTD
ncbi:MAG: hypothetical protein AAF639_10190, partial [Chloroflexota bacterium]